jgi:hypothetical protein
MGLKLTDLTPISTTGPTANIPANKDIVTKVFAVSRSDITSTLKAVLPADASVIEVSKLGNTNSDAATTATVTIVISNNTGAISTGTALDVKTAGTTTTHVQMPNLPNIEPLPLLGDLRITATYAETGTASTTGGPWYIKVSYVR